MTRLLVVLAAAGCTSGSGRVRGGGPGPPPELPEGLPPVATASGAFVARGSTLYGVHAWDGTVVRSDLAARTSEELVVGGDPTRAAVVGEDELWVTLRAEREVAVLADDGSLERVHVGAEPYGIAPSPDGTLVYVALSQEDRVLEIDAATRAVLRTFAVRDDPRWLAIHPSGHALFVAFAFEARVQRLDLRDGTSSLHDAPGTTSPVSPNPPLGGRATGDPAISPAGDTLVVPVLYADIGTPGPQPSFEGGVLVPPPVPYYVTDDGSLGRFNPALVVFDLEPADGRVLDTGVDAVSATGLDLGGVVRGYLSRALYDPLGLFVLAPFEGADALVLVDPTAHEDGPGSGFEGRRRTYFDLARNPYGVAVTEDGQAWVQERGTRTVARLDVDAATLAVLDDEGTTHTFHALDRFAAGASRLDADLEAGRALFYSAVDPGITTPGSGVSCATCHFEGRNDGWTWAFDDDPRQTPSLAGPVSLTAPVTWTDEVPTVSDEAVFTSVGRMGGLGLADAEVEALAAFVDWTPDVDVPDRGTTDPLVLRGAELFARADVACASCHSGPRYTDNETHYIHPVFANTPTLVGVSATPPYFHDGRAATLADVLLASRDGSMGSTAALSDEDLAALEAFLASL